MQNFPNSPVPYHSGIGRSGAVIGSSYLPHHADLQMSPRNSEDFVTLQAQSLQNHGLHMRSHLHPSTVHSYGSRRASGEMAQGCANARDMGNPYRKETLDYYFTSAGQDRNRRVGASYGAGFRYVDGHAPQQFQHLPGPVPASRGMSPYSVDYSTAVGSGNGGASSFSPSQQFNVTHSPSAQSGAQIQRQLIQKYPTHQALHQSQVSQGFSLSGSRMTPQFGHYSPVNAATCSSGMYLSPPQRYDTSNTDAMSNSPTPTNLQNNTSVNRCEGSASSYSSTANPTKSPQSQSMHKPATLSQSWSAAAFESSVKGQLHGSTKPPSINSVSSPTLPLQSSQDINKSPMQSQIQSAQQNFSPISNSSPVPSATQSPSCSSSSSPGMGSLEAHSTTSHLPPSRSTLAPNAHSSQSQGHLQAISQLSPTPNSNSSISSCSSLGTNASSFNHSTSIAHSTIGQTRKRLGIQACLRDDTVLYSHEKLLQDTGLNSLNALTSQVENLPNTVQHTVLTDYLLSQKKSRDSAQQLLHQTVSGCQNRPEGSSCLSSANEERIEQKPSSDQQKEPKNKTRCTSNESEILNDPPSQNQTEQVNSHLNLFVASSETKTIDSRSPPSSLSSYSKPPATPFPIHSNCVPDQDFKVAHPERSKRRVTKVTTDEGGEVSRDPTLNRGSENTAASAEKHRSPLSPSEVDAFHHNNPSQIISKPEPQGVGVIVAACSEPSNKLSKHGDVKSTLFTVSHHLNSKTETKNYNGKGENCIEDFSPFAPISPKAKLVEKCPSSQPQPASVKYSKSELQFNSCASKGISGPRSGLCTNRFQNYPSMQATRNETFAEEISRSAVPRSENSSSQFQQSFPSLLQEVLQGHHLERHYLRSDQTSSAHNSHDMLHVCQQPRLGLLDSLNSQEVLSQTVLSGPNIHINQTGSSKPPNLKQIQCLGNEIISNSQHFWESEAYKPSVTHGDSLEKRKTSLSSRQTVHLQSDFSADSSKHHAITGNSAVQQRRAVRYGPTPSAVQQLLLQDSETLTNSQSQTQNISFSGRRSVICDVSPSQRPTPETASVIQQPLSSVYSADVYVMKEEYKGTKAKKSESSQIDSAELDVDSCCNNPPDQNLKKTFYPTVETDSDIEMNIGDRCKNGSSSIFPFCSQMSSNPLSSPPKPQSFSETIVSSQMVPYCYSESVDVSKTSHSAPHKPYLLIPNHSKTASSTHMSHTSFHSHNRLEWPVIKQKLKDDPDKLTEIKCKSLSATDVIPVQHTSHLHPASQFHMKTWDACHKSEQVDLTETVSSQVAARTEEKTTAPETVKLRHGIQTRQRPSAETNPLMLRRRVRSFISPIPAKRQNQEVPGQQSSTYSSSLSVDNFRKVFNNSESQPKVASLKMHHTISSTDSSTQAKTKTFPKKSRGLKLEAIVQKITPSMKKNDFSNSHMECDFSVVSNYISDRPDTEATAAFPQAEDDCLSFLGDSSLDELMPYRVSGKDPYSSECQGLESNTSVASSRALPKDFDFGLASAVSSGSLLGESKDDFSLLGPLPPQPPLLCPVQGSPPPSSSALSDIQQFTNTYQQLETRRSEQSAVNLLRQKLQDPGQGLDDYTGRDCYTGHSQSLILSRASQHHISSIRPTSLEPKTSEKLVPKGYFPSGKKKGRPVGSVNKQKRAQAQSASVNVFAAPQSSPTGSTVTPDFAQPPHMSTSPGPQPCPFSPSSSETFLLTVDQESEETLEMDREAAKLEQTKEKEIEENADSSRKQRGGGRDLSSKEELFNQTNSKGNMSLCGLLTDGRSNFFSPYVHVEKKVSEIGAVCTIVNGEEEKSKGNGKAGQCASDGPSNATLPTSLVRRERQNEKTVDNWLCESTDSSVQSGMSLPTSRYVLAGPVVCEAGYTGQLLCCLCQKWANYKNLGDLYGPFYPADHAAKLPKNPPPMRQIPSLGGGFGMGYGMSAIAMESNALGFSSQECHTFKSYTDSDCMVSQATNPASPSTTSDTCFPGAVKAVEAFQLSRLVPHFWGQDDTVALGLGTSDIDKLGRVISSTVKQLLPEEVQIRPQHRKLTSHPRFKRRHKSSDEPRMVSINSKASLPFQPPPPSLDSLGPIAQLARLPLVPLDSKELWVHEACVVWTSGVYLVNGRLYGLQEALDGARETSCSHCELVGSTLGCYSKGCTLRYHYLCAIEADCALNEDNFSLRCPKHKSNRISKAVASNLEASERG